MSLVLVKFGLLGKISTTFISPTTGAPPAQLASLDQTLLAVPPIQVWVAGASRRSSASRNGRRSIRPRAARRDSGRRLGQRQFHQVRSMLDTPSRFKDQAEWVRS